MNSPLASSSSAIVADKDAEVNNQMLELMLKDFKKYTILLSSFVLNCVSKARCCQFREKYAIYCDKKVEVYVYMCSLASRRLVWDCFVNVSSGIASKARNNEFISHPEFEKVIVELINCKDKYHHQIVIASRPLDVAYNVVIKIECLDEIDQSYIKSITLHREYEVLKYIWSEYVAKKWDFDDMIGIPIVFEYKFIANKLFVFTNPDSKRIDLYGQVRNIDITLSKSSLSYMTMEKLGPNVKYLLQLQSFCNQLSLPIFHFATAFKIFDQLICRLIVLHRLSVVHGDVCPSHLYFGRAKCINVLYISNFKSSICLSSKYETSKKSLTTASNVHVRFMPVFTEKRTDFHPIDDIESAFYVLLSMITSKLPWDLGDYSKDRMFRSNTSDSVFFEEIDKLTSFSPLDLTIWKKRIRAFRESYEVSKSVLSKMRDLKIQFWKSPLLLRSMMVNIKLEHSQESNYQVNLACQCIMDLYFKIKDLLMGYCDICNDGYQFCRELRFPLSRKMTHYNDMRSHLLLYFNFESHSGLLKDSLFANKEHHLSRVGNPIRVAWDLSIWCFSNIEVTSGSIKLSSKRNIYSTDMLQRSL